MAKRRRSKADLEARRRLAPRMQAAGEKVRRARRRRRWTQAELGRRVGLSQSGISRLELGEGAAHSVLVWERVAMMLDVPLRFEVGRDASEEPADAGHLKVQELMLRLGRAAGYHRTFELPTKRSRSRSAATSCYASSLGVEVTANRC